MRVKTPMAFPCENDHDKSYNWINPGMTLRDYFAAKAMQALVASPHMPDAFQVNGVANKAYLMADAMLKARDAE